MYLLYTICPVIAFMLLWTYIGIALSRMFRLEKRNAPFGKGDAVSSFEA